MLRVVGAHGSRCVAMPGCHQLWGQDRVCGPPGQAWEGQSLPAQSPCLGEERLVTGLWAQLALLWWLGGWAAFRGDRNYILSLQGEKKGKAVSPWLSLQIPGYVL